MQILNLHCVRSKTTQLLIKYSPCSPQNFLFFFHFRFKVFQCQELDVVWTNYNGREFGKWSKIYLVIQVSKSLRITFDFFDSICFECLKNKKISKSQNFEHKIMQNG